MRLSLYALMLLNPAPAEGGGGAGGNPNPAPESKGGANVAPADYTAAVRETERFRTLYEETKGKLPPEGSRVLTAEEVKDFDAYAKLGLKPAEIASKLAERDTFAGEVSAFRRNEMLDSAASASGLNAAVLRKLAPADLVVELKDATVDGKAAKVAEVVATAKDGKGADVVTRTPLAKYAEATWPEFKASLAASVTPTGPGLGTPRVRPRATPAPQTQGADPTPAAERPRYRGTF